MSEHDLASRLGKRTDGRVREVSGCQHPLSTRFAFEFVEELDSLSNTEEVTNLITRFTAEFGLEQCIFYSSVPSPEKRLDTIVLTRPSPGITEWLKVYSDGGFADVDLSCAA